MHDTRSRVACHPLETRDPSYVPSVSVQRHVAWIIVSGVRPHGTKRTFWKKSSFFSRNCKFEKIIKAIPKTSIFFIICQNLNLFLPFFPQYNNRTRTYWESVGTFPLHTRLTEGVGGRVVQLCYNGWCDTYVVHDPLAYDRTTTLASISCLVRYQRSRIYLAQSPVSDWTPPDWRFMSCVIASCRIINVSVLSSI